jgi:predicted phosphodiesterase
MAFGQHTLKFLHISDLHLKGAREKEPWRRRRVLGKAWQRNLETLLNEEGEIDFVFFTGDAAQSGQPDEFDDATAFLTSLCSDLTLKHDRLFVIPGNHDIDRSIEPQAWEKMRMSLAASSDLLSVSRWMNGLDDRPPHGFDGAWKNAVLSRQRPYRDWVRDKLQRPALASQGLGYRVAIEPPGWSLPVHIIGLDTAWLCGDSADKGHLLLTENQLGTHLTTESDDPLPGLRIALMHHPLSDLADSSSSKRLLADYADLILRGHLHETEVVEWIEPERRLRELAAGSLYEGGLADTYGNSCHFVRLDLDSQLRPVEALVRFRSFSPKGGHWFDDNSLYSESKNGRLTWKFHYAVSNKPNPYSPWTPRPEHCFGRANTFRQLEAAFDERRSIWFTGDWRIGKTTLLLAWEKRLRERGITARLVSGQGAAGISVADFVKVVTGLDSPSDPDGAANRLASWIEVISRSGLPPVILVDEVESVVQTCDVRFFERLRDLLGMVCLVFSSREAPDEVFSLNNKTSPITNRFQTIPVGLLEPGGDEATIQHGASQLGPGDADLMRRWCGRHCFYLQLFGSYLVEARRSGQSQSTALTNLQGESIRHFRELWRTLPAIHQQALRDAAHGIPSRAPILQRRGLVDDEGRPFNDLFAAWLRGEIA